MALEIVALVDAALLRKAADARAENERADERAYAAVQVHHAAAGKVDEAAIENSALVLRTRTRPCAACFARLPAALVPASCTEPTGLVPHPVRAYRIRECRQHGAVDEVGEKFAALGYRTGDYC